MTLSDVFDGYCEEIGHPARPIIDGFSLPSTMVSQKTIEGMLLSPSLVAFKVHRTSLPNAVVEILTAEGAESLFVGVRVKS